MKQKTVGEIFKEGPEEHASKEHGHNLSGRIPVTGSRQINDITKNGDVHAPDYQGVGFREGLEKITFKETGLPFIVYFFKFHAAKIVRKQMTEMILVIPLNFSEPHYLRPDENHYYETVELSQRRTRATGSAGE